MTNSKKTIYRKIKGRKMRCVPAKTSAFGENAYYCRPADNPSAPTELVRIAH